MRVLYGLVVLGLGVGLGGCTPAEAGTGAGDPPTASDEPVTASEVVPAEAASAIAVTSAAFEHEGSIPAKYTCDGDDRSPAMAFEHVPESAASLALICDDPDAPMGTWVHWVLIDLPPGTAALPEGAQPGDAAVGGIDGENSWKKLGYGGPCPPRGPAHRYFFRVYALDTRLELREGATRKQVDAAMEGHVLAEGVLIGTYARGG